MAVNEKVSQAPKQSLMRTYMQSHLQIHIPKYVSKSPLLAAEDVSFGQIFVLSQVVV